MDLIAPGSSALNISTIFESLPFGTPNNCNSTNPKYECFGGSFPATANISVLVALMLSKYNTQNFCPNNLSPNDVEFLLQKYAEDRSRTLGYDDSSGWGLANAGAVMNVLKYPEYKVHHIDQSQLQNQTISILPPFNILLSESINGVAAGLYSAIPYKIEKTFTLNLGSTETVFDVWNRLSSTVGLSLSAPNNGANWSDFNYSIHNNVVTINTTSYRYNLYQNSIGQSISSWLPANFQYSRTPISVHTHNPNLSKNPSFISSRKLKLWPNPSCNLILIDIENIKDNDFKIRVFDLLGKVAYDQNYKVHSDNTISIPTSSLANGVYTIETQPNSKKIYEKFIKSSIE